MSRYFDASPNILNSIVDWLGTAKVTLFTQRSVTTLYRAWLKCAHSLSGRLTVKLCRHLDEDYYSELESLLKLTADLYLPEIRKAGGEKEIANSFGTEEPWLIKIYERAVRHFGALRWMQSMRQ